MKVFEKLAADDKKRYELEMKLYNEKSGENGKKKVNGWMIYL